MQLGIDSFAAASPSADPKSSAAAIAELLERMERADRVGLDVFGIGEHHRAEFLDSAPTIILAAAARTTRITLTSAVTVLSAADPVRVFQEFATLDLVSQGRAELVVGRGSFTESFPLFGLKLQDYDELFAGDFRRHMPRYQPENFAHNLRLVAKLQRMAQAKGVTPAQLVLAWVLARGEVAIPGTKRVPYLEANVAAAALPLSAAELAELDAIMPVGSAAGAAY